jgi:ABC-type nitrate/sulfonate/bicarbonate transport system substrate-binding protein
MLKNFRGARLMAVVAAAAAAAVLWVDAAAAQAPALPVVSVAVSSSSLATAGLRMAENAGLFAKSGMQTKVITMDSGNAAMAALLSGSVQFAVAGPPEALAARARGQDVLIAVNLYRGLAGSVVMSKATAAKLTVKSDAPISERLRALDGLTVAVPSATSALLGPLKSAAAATGARVKYTYLAQPAMVAALETNAIDAMMASSPFSGVPLLKGTGVLWINGPGGDLPADVSPASSACILTTASAAAANADIVRKFRTVFDELAGLIKQKPDEAKRALAKAYPQLEAAALDLAFTQQADNWTQPAFSEADVRQEIKLLRSATPIPGLENVVPQSALLKMP